MKSGKAQDDFALHKLQQALLGDRRAMVPILSALVCLLSIQVTSLEPFKPVVMYLAFHSLAMLLFEHWVEQASYQFVKERLQLREYVTMLACLVGYCICNSRTSPENEALMSFTTLIILPMIIVCLADEFNLPSQLSLLLHFFVACSRFWGDRWGGGGQQILGLVAFHALLFKVGLDRTSAARSQGGSSIVGALSFMLSIMADGFMILNESEKIIGANEGVNVCLGTSSGPDGSELLGKAYSSIFDGHARSGLSATWFTRPDKKRVKLEMYTVPCQLTADRVVQILGRSRPEAVPRAAAEAGTCICALRITVPEGEKSIEPPEQEPSRALADHRADRGKWGFDRAGHGQADPRAEPAPGAPPTNSPVNCLMEANVAALDPGTKALAPLFFKSPWRFESLSSGALTSKGSYHRVQDLGQGGTRGSSCAAENSKGERVAIKEISLSAMKYQSDFPLHLQAISREAEALRKIAWASPVVIKLNDCWLQNDFSKACLVTEWLPHTLEEALSRFRGERLVSMPKQDARRWLSHMTAGVAAIHAAGFVHRDIQPSNVWLTGDYQRCKIAGLGISRPLRRRSACSASRGHRSLGSLGSMDVDDGGSMVGSTLSDSSSMVSGLSALTSFARMNGTNAYSSPELARDCRYTEMTDIFSLGCILLEMMTLAPLAEMNISTHEESSPEEMVWSLVADARARCFEVADPRSLSVNSADLPGLVVSMISLDPTLRPSASDIIARSGRLQSYLPQILEESPKLRGVLLKRQRRVHFPRMGQLEDDDDEDGGAANSDKSSSELAPAVA